MTVAAPFANASPPETRFERPAGDRSLRTYRILLIEHNPVDAMRLRQLLARARHGCFAVESVANLSAGLERLAAGPVDLVLLDQDLPDSLGGDSLAALLASAPSVPVVVLCRPNEDATGMRSVQAGAQDYAFKHSVSAEGLARLIRCSVERHRVVTSLRGLTLTDELTGLLNRRGFATLAQGHLRLASRTGQQFVLFFFDVDHLKRVNDDRGHHEGDRLLARAADVLRATFRQSDVVARFGGDEFVALAVDTSGDGGDAVRRRLLANVERSNSQTPDDAALSLSVGCLPFDGRLEEPLGALIGRADQVLYAEKRGRCRPDA